MGPEDFVYYSLFPTTKLVRYNEHILLASLGLRYNKVSLLFNKKRSASKPRFYIYEESQCRYTYPETFKWSTLPFPRDRRSWRDIVLKSNWEKSNSLSLEANPFPIDQRKTVMCSQSSVMKLFFYKTVFIGYKNMSTFSTRYCRGNVTNFVTSRAI